MKRPRDAGAARASMLKAIISEIKGFLFWLCITTILMALLVGVTS